jgi:hypothetical protein|tara:strand:+ start:2377 stop:2886 length:510 start_codon:yes stop_codon:yes gene_type:complete
MAPAQSKHLICLIGVPFKNEKYVNDFNTKSEDSWHDHHCWCEDDFGKVYDPTYLNETESRVGKIKENRCYMKWDNQKEELKKVQEPMWKKMFKDSGLDPNENNEEHRFKIMGELYEEGEGHTPLQCTLNAQILQQHRPDLKVVIGSFGWKKIVSKKGNSRPVIDIYWGQ